MRKIILYTALALLAVIIIPIAYLGLRIPFDLGNPMRQSKEQIRESILELTPIGMRIEDVIKIMESNEKWESRKVNYNVGVTMAIVGYPDDPEDYALNKLTVKGKKSTFATIGGYANFFNVFVDVWWAFDEDSKLIEVYVKKTKIGF